MSGMMLGTRYKGPSVLTTLTIQGDRVTVTKLIPMDICDHSLNRDLR